MKTPCWRQYVILSTTPEKHCQPSLLDENTVCYRCRLSALFHFFDKVPMTLVTAQKSAEILNVSESRFRHLFKEHMGFSFHQYVIRLRLERAKKMLCEENITLQQVMENLHITHSSNFFADFKRAFGLTPNAMRRDQTGCPGTLAIRHNLPDSNS